MTFDRQMQHFDAAQALWQETPAEDLDTRKKLERHSTRLFWRGTGIAIGGAGSEVSAPFAATTPGEGQ